MSIKVEIVYEDSEVGRGSVINGLMHRLIDAFRVGSSSNPNWMNTNPKDLIEDVMKRSVMGCKKESSLSNSDCEDLINNAAWEVCEMDVFKKTYDFNCGLEYRRITTLDTSSWWFGGVCGLLAGLIVAIFVWMTVYCLFLKKKKNKGGAGPNQISPKIIN